MTQAVEPGKLEALISNPSTTKKLDLKQLWDNVEIPLN
jgi:hypothetical protein